MGQRTSSALEHAPEGLLGNAAFMTAAVWLNGLALEWASPKLRNDRDFMLGLVQRNGFALKYASRKQLLGGAPRNAQAQEVQRILSESCEKQQAMVRCPLRHGLQLFAAPLPVHGSYACDLCEAMILPGSQLWGCLACCFDVCCACSERTEARHADDKGQREETPDTVATEETCSTAGPCAYLVGSWDGYTELTKLAPLPGGEALGASIRLAETTSVPRAVRLQVLTNRGTGEGDLLGPAFGDDAAEHEVWLPAKASDLHVSWDLRTRSTSWKLGGLFGDLAEVPRHLGTAPLAAQFSLAGSWDDWNDFTPFMPAGSHALQAHVRVSAAPGLEEFMVVQEPDIWQQRYYVAENGRDVIGPTSQAGRNWRVEVPSGCHWLRVVWRPWGKRCRLAWSFLSSSGEKLEASRRARRLL